MDCWSIHLLVLLSSLLFGITTGQENPPPSDVNTPGGSSTCDEAWTTEAATLFNNNCKSDQPSCFCSPTTQGISLAVCQNVQPVCSTLDSSVCGYQSAALGYFEGNKLVNYLFTYDNGVMVYFTKYMDMCEAYITDAAGTETPCECNFKDCLDGSSKPNVDCDAYENGAVADACMDNWGVQGGVMLALSIKTGSCVASDNVTDEPAPVASPVVVPAPVPVAAPVSVQPPPPPAPTDVKNNTGFTCDGLTAEAATLLNAECGSGQPSCSCNITDTLPYGVCIDTSQPVCSTLDSSVCGIQGAVMAYENDGNKVTNYVFLYDNYIMVSFTKYMDTCEASITDAAGTDIPCECNFKDCPDGSSKPYINCGVYESGAVADACMDDWGLQGGILLALSIKRGMCVAADDKPTDGVVSPTMNETAPVAAPTPMAGSADAPPTADTIAAPVAAPTPEPPITTMVPETDASIMQTSSAASGKVVSSKTIVIVAGSCVVMVLLSL